MKQQVVFEEKGDLGIRIEINRKGHVIVKKIESIVGIMFVRLACFLDEAMCRPC